MFKLIITKGIKMITKQVIKDLKKTKSLNENKYKMAYSMLMDYFDFIPEEDKNIVHEKLKELGL